MEEGKGCQFILAIVFGLIAASFIFQGNNCGRTQGMNGPNPTQQPAMISLKGQEITADFIEKQIQAERNQATSRNEPFPPSREAEALGRSVYNSVDTLAILELAKQKNIDLSDGALERAITSAIEDQVKQLRQQWVAQKTLNANFTEAEAQAVFKKQFGREEKDYKATFLKQQLDTYKDPFEKMRATSQLANQELGKLYAKETTIDDALLNKSFETLVTKRVYLTQAKNAGVDLMKKINEIASDIKAGKLTFEAAMDKYTEDKPASNKPLHESTSEITGGTTLVDPVYEPLSRLKIGETSPPLDFGGSVAIYKLLSTKSEKPKDFDQQKATYRENLAQQFSATKLQAALKPIRSSSDLKFESEGAKLVYDWYKVKNDASLLPAKAEDKKAATAELLNRAKSLVDKPDASGPKWPALVRYAVLEEEVAAASPEEKKQLQKDELDAMLTVLQFAEDPALRLRICDIYADMKDGKNASMQLATAAQVNAGDPGLFGQQNYSDISAKLDKLKGLGLIDAATETQVKKSLDDWKANRAQKDAYEAKQKQEQEEAKKKFEAEQKKAAEEAKKKAEEKPKAGEPPKGANPLDIKPGQSGKK